MFILTGIRRSRMGFGVARSASRSARPDRYRCRQQDSIQTRSSRPDLRDGSPLRGAHAFAPGQLPGLTFTLSTTGLKYPTYAEVIFPSQKALGCVLRGYPRSTHRARINPWTVTERSTEQVVKLEKIIVIYDLRRQGLSISAIARKSGPDRKTVQVQVPLAGTNWIPGCG